MFFGEYTWNTTCGSEKMEAGSGVGGGESWAAKTPGTTGAGPLMRTLEVK